MQRIILSGIKHSGKSTVGWDLASRLGLYFADLDDLILRVNPTYTTIRQLFREEGKEGFQKEEAKSLEHFIQVNKGKSFVLSLGGGTIENEQALALLKNASVKTLYLDASEQVLLERILRGGIPPFLEGDDPSEKFKIMYQKRSNLYKSWADIIIDTREKTPAIITEEISKIFT